MMPSAMNEDDDYIIETCGPLEHEIIIQSVRNENTTSAFVV